MHQKREHKNMFWHEKQILSKIEAAATSSVFYGTDYSMSPYEYFI